MIKRLIFFVIIICVVFVLALFIKERIKNNPQKILSKLPEKEWEVFNPNKKLVYLVKYMYIIPAGEAVIGVKGETEFQNKKVYHLEARAETGSFLSHFYKAKAVIQSFMDSEKLYTYKYTEDLYLPEGEHRSKLILYNQEKNIAQRKEYKIKILPNTQDPLSAIFYLRKQKFEPGKEFSINILTKEDNYEMKTKVLTKANSIWHLVIDVARWDRSSSHGGRFFVWMSDDERRLPVLIKALTKAGPVTLRLVAINSE